MINLKTIRYITLAAFIQIAIQILFFYFNVNNIPVGKSARFCMVIVSVLTYLAIIIYLLNILKLFGEKNSVITAFKIYAGVELLLAIFTLCFNFLFIDYAYYKFGNAIHFVTILYLVIQVFNIRNALIKPAFTFLGLALLLSSIIVLATPLLLTFITNYKLFSYLNLIMVIPVIAAIVIFNTIPEQLKNVQTEQKDGFGLN